MRQIDLHQIIKNELDIHPYLELVDLYKLVYQAYYGPSHIVNDPLMVAKNIELEFVNMHNTYSPLFQDIGDQSGYVRISLSILNEAYKANPSLFLTKCDLLAELIIDSCSLAQPDTSMNDVWTQNYATVLKYYTPSVNEEDCVFKLAASASIPSHSDKYRMHYHPHYRIVYMQNKSQIHQLKKAFLHN